MDKLKTQTPSTYEQITDSMLAHPRTWLITGVAGFIGSNLLQRLLQLDQQVIGLDNFSTGKRSNLEQVKAAVRPEQWKGFSFTEADICDPDACSSVCNGVDYVLHQAALGSVPHSIADPIRTNQSNVDGFVNMLVAARDCKVKRFVYAASAAAYGDHPGSPSVEDKIGRHLSPYAATKYINELYAQVFGHCYGLETIGLRYFNVFGPRQDPEGAYAAVIPKWIAAMMRNQPVFVNGDGETTRDYCYVDNVIQANVLAATTLRLEAVNQVYNVGVSGRTTLNQLLCLLREFLEPLYPHVQGFVPSYRSFRPGDIRDSQADISKAARLLGYQPDYTVRSGLSVALQWYVQNL